MFFTSLVFLFLFLPFTLPGFLLILPGLRKPLLLVASLVFCAWGGVSYVTILIAIILSNYLFGILLGASPSPKTRSSWLIMGLLVNVLALLSFKYTSFFETNFNILILVFKLNPVHVSHIILPLGISFFTLRGISYLVTVYRQQAPAQRNVVELGLYIGFFPTLLAGPIERYKDMEPQLAGPFPGLELFASGVRRFALGLAKKIIISAPLASVANQVFGTAMPALNSPLAWLGLISFVLQFYYEFSGYADMAIGLGRMFGFRFSENFNFPFTARSVSGFWERWNITLNTWLLDYIFLPLTTSSRRPLGEFPASPKQSPRSGFVILLIFLLWGSWYGAGWNFIVFGLVFGLLFVLEKTRFGLALEKSPAVVAKIYTLFFVLMAWVVFRLPDLHTSIHYYKVLFGIEGARFETGRVLGYFNREYLLSFILAIAGCTKIFDLARRKITGLSEGGNAKKPAFHAYTIITLLLVVLVLVYSGMTVLSQPSVSLNYFRF